MWHGHCGNRVAKMEWLDGTRGLTAIVWLDRLILA